MSNTNYIIGNSKNLREIFAQHNLPAAQLIVSSPPYFDVLNYEDNDFQIGHRSLNYKSYIEEVTQIYQDCYDLSSDDASLWIVIDTFKRNGALKLLPFDIVNHLSKAKKTWVLKEVIIWDKQKNLPWNAKGKFKNQFEYILYFTKGSRYQFHIDSLRELLDLKKWWKTYPERYNPNGKAPSNIWSITTPIRGWGNSLQNHLCPLPFQLAEKIINLSSQIGDVVLDPFAGSGTLLGLAEIMGRHSIGIDINENYKTLFESEVVLGATRYWENRKNELIKNDDVLINFKETILKLRKQKLAMLLCQVIKKKYEDIQFTILLNDRESKTIYFIITPIDVDLGAISSDELILNYLKQAKIKSELKYADSFHFEEKFNVYRYSYKQFFRKIKREKIDKITNVDNDHFFSTIDLLILN